MFISSGLPSLRSWRSAPPLGVCLEGLGVLLWGRQVETRKWAVWSEEHLGRMVEKLWSAFGRGGTSSPGTKEVAGNNMLPCPLAQGQKHLLKTVSLGAGFLLCFTVNSVPWAVM